MNWLRMGLALTLALAIASCSSNKRWEYQYRKGKTAVIVNGKAVPPAGLPEGVMKAIAAGNRIVGKPYRRGGGHGRFEDSAYDCSGTVSYVLHAIGKLDSPTTSTALRKYGRGGGGRWITVYASKGHCFIEVAGLRLDTGYNGDATGPAWTTQSRPLKGYKVRHPSGF